MAPGGGLVELGSGALALAFQRLPYPAKMIERLRGLKGTANQELMALASGLFEQSLREQAIEGLGKMLAAEEAEGPNKWEVTPPDTHGGMYALAHVAIIAAGWRLPENPEIIGLARRAAVIVGQELRMGDLIATPDGDCRGWPGMRAPHGAKMDRIYLTKLYREVRGRQGKNLPHRGTGGGLQPLKWNPEDDGDRLYSLPAVWLREILVSPAGPNLLSGPLSPNAPLPRRLRLAVTVYRWPGYTLAVMADPGPDKRGQFQVRGSAAAKRSRDQIEHPVDWILVEHRVPAKHHVEAGQSWQTPPPVPPAGAIQTSIPGFGSSAGPANPVPDSGCDPDSAPHSENRSSRLKEVISLLSGLQLSNRQRAERASVLSRFKAGEVASADVLLVRGWFRPDSPQEQAVQWRKALEILEALL